MLKDQIAQIIDKSNDINFVLNVIIIKFCNIFFHFLIIPNLIKQIKRYFDTFK